MSSALLSDRALLAPYLAVRPPPDRIMRRIPGEFFFDLTQAARLNCALAERRGQSSGPARHVSFRHLARRSAER